MAGTRMKRVTESAIKQRRARQARKTRQQMVNLRDQIGRWKQIHDEYNLQHDGEVAKLLIDGFFEWQNSLARTSREGEAAGHVTVDTQGNREPTNLVMDCETVADGIPHGDTHRNQHLPREPTNLVMDCETVADGTPHGDTPRNQHLPREPTNLVMDCETVADGIPHGNTHRNQHLPRNVGHLPSDHVLCVGFVDFHSIHGLPVNQPFSLKYSSPMAGSVVESKTYIIVEHSCVPNITATPIRIGVKGSVHEKLFAPNDWKVWQNLEEVSSLVDVSHLKQLLASFKNHSNVPQSMPDIKDEPQDFENVTVKIEWDEDEKYDIVANIMYEVIDKVVSQSKVQQNEGHSNSKRKSGSQTMYNFTKKRRLLKYEDNTDRELPHCSRSRSKGYRVNYADMDKLGDISDASDLDDILSDSDKNDEDSITSDNKVPGSDECEVSDHSVQKKSKAGKKVDEEDPDFDVRTYFLTESDKKKLKDAELDSETANIDQFEKSTEYSSSDSLYGSPANAESSNAEKKMSDIERKELDKEKQRVKLLQKKLEERSKRIRVFLQDHPDKYYTEDQVSAERKFRGLKEADKTFKLLVCAICNQFRTSNKVQLETHLEHHLNGDWKCKKCDFEANTLQEYRKHLKEKHPFQKKHTCLICKVNFGMKKQFHEHLVTAHNLLPYVCTLCSTNESHVMFKNDSDYRQHYLENHKDVMHQCPVCGLHFVNNDMDRHVCRQKESNRSTCDICGKEMRRCSIPKHKSRVHDNVRPFPCQLCSYAAGSAPGLRDHVLAKHEGVHRFECDVCEFTCVRKHQLVSHMRTHTGDKPYKCDLCPYAAAWNVQLKEHKQLHGSPLGKECEICGIVVRQGAGYTNHCKKEHSGCRL